MKTLSLSGKFPIVVAICLISGLAGSYFTLPISAIGHQSQIGNTISGYVFGSQRLPIADATIELLDDYSRSISRTKSNSTGRYVFSGMRSGRYKVRVLPLGTDYEEQEQEIEIQNISRQMNGSIVTTASDNVQKDFYLRPRKTNQPIGRSEAVFVQEVPPQAQETYRTAVQLLQDKKEDEGLKLLKTSIEIFPKYFDALERLGSEYIRLKHFVPAQILLTEAVQINPRAYKSWYGLAYALYSQEKKTNEALEAVTKANSLNPDSVDSLLLTGVLLKRAGKFDQAEKPLKKAKELSKDTVAEVHWQLALLYGNNLKRYREAADELELFLKMRPESRDAENIKKLIAQFREKAEK